MSEQYDKPPTPWPPLDSSVPAQPPTLMTYQDSFFSFKLRDILEVIVIIGLGIGFLLTRTTESSTLAANLAILTTTVDKLVMHIDDIDKRGTQAGQSFQYASRERNLDQDRRINAMEAQLSIVIPDLREIKTKLNFVADLITENKKDKK